MLRFLRNLPITNASPSKPNQLSDGGPTQLEANQHMMNTLLTKDYFVVYQEYSGGHDSSSIEAPLAQGLRWILG